MSNIEYFQKQFSPGFFHGSKRKKCLKETHKIAQEEGFLFEKDARILDVGFHDPNELVQIQSFHPQSQLIGIDIYEKKKMKSISKEFKDTSYISVMAGDINKLDFEENSFNIIYLLDVLYFANALDEVVSSLTKLLKRKGTLVISLDVTDAFTLAPVSKYDKNAVTYLKINIDDCMRYLKINGCKKVHTFKTKDGHQMILAEKK